MPLSGVAEAVWRVFSLEGEPPITRFAVSQISTSHWFDLSAAEQDFGYQPMVTGEEGFQRMMKALKLTQG
jgi:nucleoside-diphosphate-sugar epimerase